MSDPKATARYQLLAQRKLHQRKIRKVIEIIQKQLSLPPVSVAPEKDEFFELCSNEIPRTQRGAYLALAYHPMKTPASFIGFMDNPTKTLKELIGAWCDLWEIYPPGWRQGPSGSVGGIVFEANTGIFVFTNQGGAATGSLLRLLNPVDEQYWYVFRLRDFLVDMGAMPK